MRIYEFITEPGREEHIAAHGVTVEEAEDVVPGRAHVTRTRQGRHRFIGQTASGRYLTVIVQFRAAGVCSLVTARDADEAERRLFRAHRRG